MLFFFFHIYKRFILGLLVVRRNFSVEDDMISKHVVLTQRHCHNAKFSPQWQIQSSALIGSQQDSRGGQANAKAKNEDKKGEKSKVGTKKRKENVKRRKQNAPLRT